MTEVDAIRRGIAHDPKRAIVAREAKLEGAESHAAVDATRWLVRRVPLGEGAVPCGADGSAVIPRRRARGAPAFGEDESDDGEIAVWIGPDFVDDGRERIGIEHVEQQHSSLCFVFQEGHEWTSEHA